MSRRASMSVADQAIHIVKEPTVRHPHPPTPAGVPAADSRVALQLTGLDRIADLLEVTRAELDDLVACDDFPPPSSNVPGRARLRVRCVPT